MERQEFGKAMDDLSKKVVFIIGSGHCGSTLLDLILGSHSRAFSLGEFSRIRKIVRDGSRVCCTCEGSRPFWDHRKFSLKLLFSMKLEKFVSPYRYVFKWSGKNVLIDSSKQQGWFKRQSSPSCKIRGIQPYLIYLIRDGRAVVSSYFRKYPERGIENIAGHWKKQMHEMNEYYDRFPHPKTKLRYEDIALRPEQTISGICNFLGLEYEGAMLNFWETDHHHVYGNQGTRSQIRKRRRESGSPAIKLDERWKNELTADQLAIFERVAGGVNKSIVSDYVCS